MAVSQQASDSPPMMARRRCSRGRSSRRPRACHASERRMSRTLTSPSAMAGNFSARNGLPTYSVLWSPQPDTGGSRDGKPAVATGTVASASAAKGRVARSRAAEDRARARIRERRPPRMCRVDDRHVQTLDSCMGDPARTLQPLRRVSRLLHARAWRVASAPRVSRDQDRRVEDLVAPSTARS